MKLGFPLLAEIPTNRYNFSMEDENLFPSGPWTGFYNYSGPEDRHRMDLHLTFARGGIAGEGNDDIGPFLIRGRYDAATKECYWTKTYIGRHDVFYRGFRDTHGIWGTWEIPPWNKGGFHIWPRAQGEGNATAKSVEADVPAEAIGTEVPATERELENTPHELPKFKAQSSKFKGRLKNKAQRSLRSPSIGFGF